MSNIKRYNGSSWVSQPIDADTLGGKAPSSFQDKLVSGTNIKTINGSSILGSGNVTISASVPIKTLKTDNAAAQTPSANESIAGSGTINLHKVAKTGSYNDLNDKPTKTDITSLLGFGTYNDAHAWGTVTNGNGYSIVWGADQHNGGGMAFGEKNGQTSLQIDGDIYVHEGLEKLLVSSDVTNIIANALNVDSTSSRHFYGYRYNDKGWGIEICSGSVDNFPSIGSGNYSQKYVSVAFTHSSGESNYFLAARGSTTLTVQLVSKSNTGFTLRLFNAGLSPTTANTIYVDWIGVKTW